MSLVTWVLILMGVGLNAAAQLLLKTATRPLSHFAVFDADTLVPNQPPAKLARPPPVTAATAMLAIKRTARRKPPIS